MKLTELFLAELERQADGTRKTLERVPEDRNDWKPHPKSMELGYLAALIAQMPAWIATMVEQDSLDLKSPTAQTFRAASNWRKREELLKLLDEGVAKSRAALQRTSDEHLLTNWQLKAGDQVLNEGPRYVMIIDSVVGHLAHHRGQMTVYLRLNGAAVPALYGPSADENKF